MSRLLILLLALLAAAVSFVDPVSAQPAAGRKIAVLIGVNEYSNRPFEDLKYAEKDMTDLKAELEKAGFSVILLLGSGKGNAEATRENIAAVLLDKRGERFALKGVTEADTVVVAFSGHGEQIPIKVDGKDEPVETPHFCPKHAETGAAETAVSLNAVLDVLDQKKATCFLWVDACRSFAAPMARKRSGASVDRAKVSALRPGIGVMFACGDRQAALEHEKAGGGHGVFFCAVLEALRTTLPNKKGQITWGQLAPKITERVSELLDEVAKDVPERDRQRPQKIDNFSGDPVLVAVAAAEPKPGEEREVEIADGVKMKFCWIPKGKAMLGSPSEEKERSKDEAEHAYEEKTGFWLGKYEVTQQQWEAVMGSNPSDFSATGGGKEKVAGLKTDSFPVEQVSFDDIYGKGWKDGEAPLLGSFLAKVNGRSGIAAAFGTGAKLRLPDEDRWEYAYRGGLGNKKPFYWGETLNGEKANCDGGYPYGTTEKGAYVARPTAVGSYESKAKHPWGLCDMSGNVWEWCENVYDGGSFRVVRGGSWLRSAWLCRAAYRRRDSPDYRHYFLGFRLAVVPSGR